MKTNSHLAGLQKNLLLTFFALIAFLSNRTGNAQVPITFGETKANQTIALGQETVFRFQGTASDLITIQMSTFTGFGFMPTVDLISPLGTVLTNVTASPSARLITYRLPGSGNFSIICRDDDGGQSGDYAITLLRYPGSNPGESGAGVISNGQVKTGLLPLSDMDIFTFEGRAGELANVQMSTVTGFGFLPTIDLISPAGTILRTVTGSPSARIQLFALPASGTYAIICRDEDGGQEGDYNLSLNLFTAPEDSDEDGLRDEWETTHFGNLNENADSDFDEDRLKNGEEFAAGTDPTKKDTDGDQYWDKSELLLGSDPLDANSIPRGLTIRVKSIDLDFSTLPGRTYELRASSNLTTWTNLQTIPGDGSVFTTTIEVKDSTYRFFKAEDVTP